jgi:hypothetical protein
VYSVRYSLDPRGGLRIASSRNGRTAALALRADAGEVFYPKCEPVSLPWDAYGKVIDHFGAPLPDADTVDGWAITGWLLNQGGVYVGVAVEVRGGLRSRTREIRDETVTWWRRFRHAFADGSPAANLVPVVMPPVSLGVHLLAGDLPNVRALAVALSVTPAYRARLDDPDRVGRLVNDLASARLARRAPDEGSVRRDPTDVAVALQQAGFVHRNGGRPLSSALIAAPDVVLAGVRKSLAANPYRKGRPMVDDEMILRIAKHNYLDVEPWPFSALVD